MTIGLDEFGIIKKYFSPLSRGESGAYSLLDDAAKVKFKSSSSTVITTDAMVSGVHFPLTEPANYIASRLLRVNLSDIAAMGAVPVGYTLLLALPDSINIEWISSFSTGLAEEQEIFGVTLLGGDTTKCSSEMVLSITMLAEAKENNVLLRSGANEGDEVYVSGYIGDAFLGLSILQRELENSDKKTDKYLIERFRRQTPRLELGKRLVGIATSAIDLSDGLISDLGHVCSASNVSARIIIDEIPISKAAEKIVLDDSKIIRNLITGGDDYELIFTVPSNKSGIVDNLSVELGVNLTKIGEIIKKNNSQSVATFDLSGNMIIFEKTGFRHF